MRWAACCRRGRLGGGGQRRVPKDTQGGGGTAPLLYLSKKWVKSTEASRGTPWGGGSRRTFTPPPRGGGTTDSKTRLVWPRGSGLADNSRRGRGGGEFGQTGWTNRSLPPFYWQRSIGGRLLRQWSLNFPHPHLSCWVPETPHPKKYFDWSALVKSLLFPLTFFGIWFWFLVVSVISPPAPTLSLYIFLWGDITTFLCQLCQQR